jgi:hypothetical protein
LQAKEELVQLRSSAARQQAELERVKQEGHLLQMQLASLLDAAAREKVLSLFFFF